MRHYSQIDTHPFKWKSEKTRAWFIGPHCHRYFAYFARTDPAYLATVWAGAIVEAHRMEQSP